MARPLRLDVANEIYHILWRGNNKEKVFLSGKDYFLFEKTLTEAVIKLKMRILSLLNLILYIERNPLKAGLVKGAEEWRWSSAWIRLNGNEQQRRILAKWPMEIPENYNKLLNDSNEDRANITNSILNEREI